VRELRRARKAGVLVRRLEEPTRGSHVGIVAGIRSPGVRDGGLCRRHGESAYPAVSHSNVYLYSRRRRLRRQVANIAAHILVAEVMQAPRRDAREGDPAALRELAMGRECRVVAVEREARRRQAEVRGREDGGRERGLVR
jgi:hypothetical protein